MTEQIQHKWACHSYNSKDPSPSICDVVCALCKNEYVLKGCILKFSILKIIKAVLDIIAYTACIGNTFHVIRMWWSRLT